MGSELNKFNKDPKYSDFFESKKSYKNRLSEGSIRRNSNLLTELNTKKEIKNNNLIKSQLDMKIIETEKEIDQDNEEKVLKKKESKKAKDNFKSLSSQNLIKIELKNNSENASPYNINIAHINESNNTQSKELHDNIDNINSIEDSNIRNIGEEIHEKIKEEIEEEKKMFPNNIKKVLNDSRNVNNKIEENKVKEEFSLAEENKNKNSNNNSQPNAITDNNFELNFNRNKIHQTYYSKLLINRIWKTNMNPIKFNSIIIFDYDDILLPTSFLKRGKNIYEEIELSSPEKEKMKELEDLVFELLNDATGKGTVYLITNAEKDWVEYSSKKFYPKIIPILDKVEIIYAREEYEKIYPGDSRQWKIEAFLMIPKTVNISILTNIICLGNSLSEIEAGRILASRFTESYIKTIKFREEPKLDELIEQLKLVCKQFSSICSDIKNMTISL